MTYTIEDVKRMVPEAEYIELRNRANPHVLFCIGEDWLRADQGTGKLLLTTLRQLEIAVEALKYIDQYNRKAFLPNSFTVGDCLNMRGEAGLALDAISKVGPKIEEPEQ